MYMIKIYVFFLRKKFIQFAFPGKGMKEIGRERKIVSNLFPIKSFEITSAKSQGSRKRNGRVVTARRFTIENGHAFFFHAAFEKSG